VLRIRVHGEWTAASAGALSAVNLRRLAPATLNIDAVPAGGYASLLTGAANRA